MLAQFRRLLMEQEIDRIKLCQELASAEWSDVMLRSLEEAAESYLCQHPDAKNVYSKLALIYSLTGNKENALRYWKQDCELGKMEWWHANRYAEVLWQDDHEAAEELIAISYRKSVAARNGYASIAWANRVGWREEADQLFTRDDKLGRLTPGFRLNYACWLAENGWLEDAERQVEQAYGEDSDLKDGLLRLVGIVIEGQTIRLKKREDAELERSHDLYPMQGDQLCDTVVRLLGKECAYHRMTKWQDCINCLMELGCVDALESLLLKHFESPIFGSDLEVRRDVSYRLSYKYYEQGHYKKAKVWGARAFEFSDYDETFMYPYYKMLVQENDWSALYELHTRRGLALLRRNNTTEALAEFNHAFRTRMQCTLEDRPVRDAVLRHVVREEARKAIAHLGRKRRCCKKNSDESLKIVYLFPNWNRHWAVNNVLIELIKEHNNNSALDVVAASYAVRQEDSSFARLHEELRMAQCEVLVPDTNASNPYLDIAQRIEQTACDVLITGYQDYEMLYTYELCSPPVLIHLIQGACSYNMEHHADACICWSPAIQIDMDNDMAMLCGMSQYALPKSRELADDEARSLSRSTFNIPADAFVFSSLGREAKFQNSEFWEMVLEVLSSNSDAYYLVGGCVDATCIKPLASASDTVLQRVRFSGFVNNWPELLRITDVYLDTYPEGGGITLNKAISVGLPTVAFAHNYRERFNPMDWSHADYLYPDNPLLIECRGDFSNARAILQELHDDPELRVRAELKGEEYRERLRPFGDFVRKLERQYQDIYHSVGNVQ